MGLKSVWIETLYRVATGSRNARNLMTPVGALIYGALILVCIALAFYVDGLMGLAPTRPGPLNGLLSAPLFVAALCLIGWSVGHFLAARGTPVPFNPPPRLVVAGPYQYTRNPMLTGVFCLLWGVGVLFGSISLCFVFTPLFIYINFWELKSIEEPELIKRLGEDYVQYRQKTPMFLPDLRKLLRWRE